MQVLIDKSGIIRDVKPGFSPRMLPQLRSEIARLRNATDFTKNKNQS